MHYEGDLYRPPSEADALILQATVGCPWNRCTYCAMYRDKTFRARPTAEILGDLAEARPFLHRVEKVFVADGDALALDMDTWIPLLEACAASPRLRRVSAYATARSLLQKSPDDLRRLRKNGLSLLYLGPESGDDETLRRVAKGSTADDHVRAAARAREAGISLSVILLLGVGGTDRSREHAHASAALITAMDPAFVSALTLTLVPGTPLMKSARAGQFTLPDVAGLLGELRILLDEARPTDAVFRTNHASNYLPLAGLLPRDRARLVAALDDALEGRVPLRPESWRGL